MTAYSWIHAMSHSESPNQIIFEETDMWTKPEVTEMRFGFEVTMYVCNR